MRRWMLIAAYGLGGFALAIAMAWAGFAVAGQRLSTPANPIDPVVVPISPTSSPSRHSEKPSPSHADDHGGSPSTAPASNGASSVPATSTPEPPRGESPSPDHHSDDGSDHGGGDD